MQSQWFVIHTLSGQEQKVKESIEKRIKTEEMGDFIKEVMVPMEKVVEVRNQKKTVSTRKLWPGYVFVDMVLLVTDAKRTTRSEVTATIRQLELVHAKVIGCVLGNVGRRERLASPGLPALAGTEQSPAISPHRAERGSPWRVTAKAQEAGQG